MEKECQTSTYTNRIDRRVSLSTVWKSSNSNPSVSLIFQLTFSTVWKSSNSNPSVSLIFQLTFCKERTSQLAQVQDESLQPSSQATPWVATCLVTLSSLRLVVSLKALVRRRPATEDRMGGRRNVHRQD